MPWGYADRQALFCITHRLQPGNRMQTISEHEFHSSRRSSPYLRPIVKSVDGRRVMRSSSTQKFVRNPLRAFFNRVQNVNKVLSILSKGRWNNETEDALLEASSSLSSCYTVSEALRRTLDLDLAIKFFRWLVFRFNWEPDSYVYCALLDRLGKARRFKEMEGLAAQCEEDCKATVATHTCLICAYLRDGDFEQATYTWRHMEKLGIPPSLATFDSAIDIYASMGMYEKAGEYFQEMLDRKIFPSITTCTILIKYLIESGKLDAAMQIFNDLRKVSIKPNLSTYSYAMLGFAEAGNMDTVINLVNQIRYYNHRPHTLGTSLCAVLTFLIKERRVDDAKMVMKEIWKDASDSDVQEKIREFLSELENDIDEQRSFMDLNCMSDLSKSDSMMVCASENDMKNESDDNASRPLKSEGLGSLWNRYAFIHCLVPWSSKTAKELERANVKWDTNLVSKVLLQLRDASVAWNFFCWVSKREGFSHDIYTYNRMIQLLVNFGDFELAMGLLEEAVDKKVPLPIHTFNIVLKYSGLKKADRVAMPVFHLLKRVGLKPDECTYKRLIGALYYTGQNKQVAAIHSKMVKAGFTRDQQSYSFLIRSFLKEGEIRLAEKAFESMCAAGIEPNIHVLEAYLAFHCRNGNLHQVDAVFKMMKKAGFTLKRQIYDWMIHVYEKADRLSKVRELMEEMGALMSNNSYRKRSKWAIFESFHTSFVQNLTCNGGR